MIFNTFTFFCFLPIVFCGYWLLKNHLRLQNIWIVAASYVFYGWWDWRFLALIAFTSGWAWLFGLLPRSKWNVALSLVINLGILAAFKYYNFFVDSLIALAPRTVSFRLSGLNIILPVGISFYTFQALSYTLDVHRGTIKPTRDLPAFFAFISFFPQLVAGPIERASNLLPQFLREKRFDYPLAVEGCRQMLWGFFKKVVVADSCAYAANAMLGCESPSCLSLWVGMFLFSFQIYGDFSGYSDIAIGCAKLFGVSLRRNFAYPYFSRDIAEFWRRWHISLTTWFRDYLYIPLGGSRCPMWRKIRNTFAIFLVSGLWHGANWTFILWGCFHAVCFLPLLLTGRNRKYLTDCVAGAHALPSFHEFVGMLVTFFLALVGWTLFRAPDVTTAFAWIAKMFSFADFRLTGTHISAAKYSVWTAIALLLIIEWFNRTREIPAVPKSRFLRTLFYYLVVVAIFYWDSAPQSFIYFQF